MHAFRYRPLAAILSAVWLLTAVAPVAADDPGPTPDPSVSPEAPAEPEVHGSPTIHAEMLAENAGVAMEFTPGGDPEPLVESEGGVGTMSLEADGGVSALPSGLRKEVFGYLPYWVATTANLKNLNYDLVSTIAYFSVGANSNGTLAKTASNGQATVGWAGWTSSTMSDVISKAHRKGVKVVLTVTMMAWNYDFTAMSTLLKSSTNRNRLATEIANAVKSRGADGVNLDFEPVPTTLKAEYTAFVRQVKSELNRVGAGSFLTVATTGGAASWSEGFDLPGLTASGAADALMVMAYDFNWSGSSRAGGVAPIDSPYVLDSRRALRDYLAQVPGSKLIWGVPYYGRAWTTTTSSLNGRTCITTGTCTVAGWAPRYVDALGAIASHGRRWDSTGQVPWYTYHSSTYGTYVQAYYDDAQSLGAKYGLVKNNGLRGIGIWHLLMDGTRAELWNALANHFANLPFTDVSRSPFLADIIWLANAGITKGCGGTKYCPTGHVKRDQMASFLARALNLPAATRDYFTDDNGNLHEADINRVAAAGITVGCGGTKYCPSTTVKRDQMASFLARAFSLPTATTDYFTDDNGSAHEADINRIARAGISLGCGGGRYCPAQVVTREQMAAFLRRGKGY